MRTLPPPRRDAPVVLAAIAGAHGVRGEVRLKLFASGMELLCALGELDVDGRPMRLGGWREGAHGPLVRLEPVTSREAAEALRGALVTVHRDRLPPLDDGEFYWHDLLELEVIGPGGERLGKVAGVDNHGASDVIEVALDEGGTHLVPLTPDAVTELAPRVRLSAQWLP